MPYHVTSLVAAAAEAPRAIATRAISARAISCPFSVGFILPENNPARSDRCEVLAAYWYGIWNLEKSYIPGIFPEYSQVKHMSDIFLDIPGICRPCFYASNMSGICLTYTFRVIWRLSLEYSRHILSESFENMLGIFLAYSSASDSACSSNALGMQLRTYFWRQGNLMIGTIRGSLRHTGA